MLFTVAIKVLLRYLDELNQFNDELKDSIGQDTKMGDGESPGFLNAEIVSDPLAVLVLIVDRPVFLKGLVFQKYFHVRTKTCLRKYE